MPILVTKKWVIHSEIPELRKTYSIQNKKEIKALCQKNQLKKLVIEKDFQDLMIFESGRPYGSGLVFTKNMDAKNTICHYLGVISRQKKIEDRAKQILKTDGKAARDAYLNRFKSYGFTLDKNLYIAADSDQEEVGVGRFINHNATRANAAFKVLDKKEIEILTIKKVRTGSQVLFDYGPIYHYGKKLAYIHPWQNHMFPNEILHANENDYVAKPRTLTPPQCVALGISYDKVLIPAYLDLLCKHKDLAKIRRRLHEDPTLLDLPLIEIKSYEEQADGSHIHMPDEMIYMDPLHYACVIGDSKAIKFLCESNVDVYSRATNDRDPLTILALMNSHSEAQFIKLAKPIIEKMNDPHIQSGPLGSIDSQLGDTILHYLVEKEWCHALTLFKYKKLFNQKNCHDYDPVMYAIANKKSKALSTLMEMGLASRLGQSESGEKRKDQLYVLQRALEDKSPGDSRPIHNLLATATRHDQKLSKIYQQCLFVISQNEKSIKKTKLNDPSADDAKSTVSKRKRDQRVSRVPDKYEMYSSDFLTLFKKQKTQTKPGSQNSILTMSKLTQ